MPRPPSAAAEDYSGLGLCLGGSEERQQPRPLHRSAHTLGPWLQSRPCSLGLASGWGARVLGWHSLTPAWAGSSRLQDWPSGLQPPREPLGTHTSRDSALDIPVFPTCSDPS